MISGKKFFYSLKNGVRGLFVVSKENNFKIILSIAFLVIVLSVILPLKRWEYLFVIFSIGFVISIEMLNSKLERILDLVNPTYNKDVKDIKDISAGAVLVASATTLIIGILIFTPHLLDLIN